MDIGTAFLLGVLVGQWVLLFIIWRAVNKLVVIVTEQETTMPLSSSIDLIEYRNPNEDLHPKFRMK